MNANLNRQPLKRFRHGKLINRLYTFDVRWYEPKSIIQPYDFNGREVGRLKKAIKANKRIESVVVLKDYGIVAGVHLLEAFKALRYERIPILYGKLKNIR